MDDDIVIRALTIGASVFITLATVTAVMMYYNTARLSVVEIGTGTNIEKEYREDIKNVIYKSEITGSELKNVLQYFYMDKGVNICLDMYYSYHENGKQISYIKVDERQNINLNSTKTFENIMKNMMPNQKFKVARTGEKYEFTLLI
ncbi:MAG: hypothetical protein RR144_02965 [Clostridia bacterium]